MTVVQPAPLAGVRVLDLTRLLPGAYATSLLSGLGADVVKVEDPRSGDGLRVMPPYTSSGESGVFVQMCHGKRSVALDLKHARGRTLMLELVAGAHVLVDSFRPGVLDRLGLGADALAAANRDLVHISMTAYGDGSRAALPGHDLNAEAYAGVLGLSRGPDGMPAMPAVQVSDMTTGLQAALAVVAGLRVSERAASATGSAGAGSPSGFRADVTMLDSVLSVATVAQGSVVATGAPPPTPDVLTGGLASYAVYRCSDGLEIACGALEPQFFSRVAELVGDPSLAQAQYDVAGQDALRGRLSRLFAERPRHEWLALLEEEQTCVTPVRTAAEALADPDLLARRVVVEVPLADGTSASVGRAAAWAPAPAATRGAPTLGADTDEVLRALGHDPTAVRATGALG
jgi:crotonobetainyl-CoA:carnitine CoA-transferase CaiB-like acyl-CoA transferase